MPTIAIIDGVRIVIYLKDHLPPHLHAMFAEHEAQISIVTGDILNGSLPPAKAKSVNAWLATNREQVASIWKDIREGSYSGGRIE